MQAEVITRIETLCKKADGKVVEIDGQQYTTTELHDPRKKLPEPEVLTIHTLKGLVEYLAKCPDGLKPEEHLIHVVGPNEVQLVSKLLGHFQQRFVIAKAVTPNAAAKSPLFSFGQFSPAEDMVITLQSLFEDSGDRAKVLSLLGVVNDEVVKTQSDDGITQTVGVKAGVGGDHLGVDIPNPVTLTPFRTFREVDQPASEFILRGKPGQGGTVFALFEAEGNAWELAAVQNIAAWLEEKATGYGIIS